MPRTRPYTRKELETLRRADLQNLYKIHGLKGANQKSDALIDALEAYFTSKPAVASPVKANRPVPGAVTSGMARQLKPIDGQGHAGGPVQRGPVSRPVTRKSPLKGVGAGISKDRARARGGEPVAVVDKAIEKTARPNPPRPTLPPLTSTNDSLLRRVTTLTSKLEDLESTLSVSRLDTLTSDITFLREEVARLDKEVIALRESAAERDKEWEKRLEEVERGWKGKLEVTESVWEERFKVLETKISGSRIPAETSKQGAAGTAVSRQSISPSSTVLGKRRERSPNPFDLPGFPSDPASSPKRARPAETSPTRADLIALARRSASPRTPSPTKTPSDRVFKTPDLPASVLKGRPPFPRTPSPGHQGVLPDNSATPSSVSDSNYFAGLPPMDSSRGRKKKREDEEPLPFPLFATTPRPSAPLSPTTDAPPSTIRRARQGSIVQGDMVLTPGRRPTRTVSHAHMELSSAMDSRSTSLETPSNPSSSRIETVPIQGSRIVFPEKDPIPSTSLTDILGPELTRETSVPRGLSPSPSITETRFSTLPFPPTSAKSSRSVSNTTLATTTTAAELELRSLPSPSKVYMQSISKPPPQTMVGMNTPEGQVTPTMQTTPIMGSTPGFGLGLGMGMITPGHRTMLGTERYRDTRFGDSEVMMGWGTPEMGLETPRGGGDRM